TGSSWRWQYPLGADTFLEVEFSTQAQQLKILKATLVLLVSVLAIAVAAAILAWRYGQRITTPLVALREGIHRIRDGELDTRIDISAPGELAELRDSLNEMTAALRDAQAELQQNVDQAKIGRASCRERVTCLVLHGRIRRKKPRARDK